MGGHRIKTTLKQVTRNQNVPVCNRTKREITNMSQVTNCQSEANEEIDIFFGLINNVSTPLPG